jgi:hypothetical protein
MLILQERSLAEIVEWRGKTYYRSDVPVEPRVGSPAQPWHIPIKGQFGKTSGVLGTTKVTLDDSTVRQVVYPQRGGAHDPRNVPVQARPHYYQRDEANRKHRVYMVQCSQCAYYQRREAFSPDSRKVNGLASVCKECHAANMRRAYQVAIAA